MKIVKDSHLDHGLSQAVINHLLDKFASKDAFFIEEMTLPPELGEVPCGLYGPIMGDAPISEDEVYYTPRGERKYTSRMIRKPKRTSRVVTVIAGPDDGEPCVLYTAFGGPLAPREPNDPTLPEEKLAESQDFWAQHALSSEE